MSIIMEKYKEYRDKYIASLPERFKRINKKDRTSYSELDKWRGIIDFKNNWDLSSNDLINMIDRSFINILDFLDTFRVFPVGMLKQIARENPNAFVEAFKELFNENGDVENNYNKFLAILEKDRVTRHPDLRYYQGLHQATFYLSMMYPDKYFIYNLNSNMAAVKALFNEQFKSGQPIDKYNQFITYAEEVRQKIINDNELINAVNKYKDKTCYDDKLCYMLTTDFLYFVGWQAEEDKEEMMININEEKLDKLIDLYKEDLDTGAIIKLEERKEKLDKFANYDYNSYINMSDMELKNIFLRMYNIGGRVAGK